MRPRYITSSLEKGHPTCLAKILGLFQVHVKHAAGRWGVGGAKEAAREQQLNFLVVENLFYGHDIAVK